MKIKLLYELQAGDVVQVSATDFTNDLKIIRQFNAPLDLQVLGVELFPDAGTGRILTLKGWHKLRFREHQYKLAEPNEALVNAEPSKSLYKKSQKVRGRSIE